jgi:hypothetical protein
LAISIAQCTGSSGLWKKTRRHPVTRGNGNELPIGFAGLKLRGFPHHLIELLDDLALLVHEQFRITDHIHEQDVSNGEVSIRFQSSNAL